jgi:hypothetical protein
LRKYGAPPYGFAIAGEPGFWQVDNGDVDGAAGGLNRGLVGGAGPYYDSNGGAIVPYNFLDTPEYYAGVGSYLYFTTIPAWDVSKDGNNYILVGDYGVRWGFKIKPVPAPLPILGIGAAFRFSRKLRRLSLVLNRNKIS